MYLCVSGHVFGCWGYQVCLFLRFFCCALEMSRQCGIYFIFILFYNHAHTHLLSGRTCLGPYHYYQLWPLSRVEEILTSIISALLSLMVFNVTFNNISVISWRSVLLVEETGGPGGNHRPVVSYWQTLSHNVVYTSRYTRLTWKEKSAKN
jgi:hypothetical protein